MNGVREFALTSGWLVIGAALTGCATQSGRTSVTPPGVFASIDGGVTQLDVDDLGNTLEVDEDTSASVQLGLGYQVNQNVAVELRAGDLGSAEFTDGRELTFQHADLSGLLMWRQGNASVFGRFGFGTFNNGGDFDVDLESPVHAVIGGGVAYHVLPSLDLRLSLTTHGSDAVVGSAGLVWRFGAHAAGQPSTSPRVSTAPDNNAPSINEDDGFEPVAPVARDEVVAESDVSPIESGEDASDGLIIDEKPAPESQTFPEPVVSNEVAASVEADLEAERARLASQTTAAAPVPSSGTVAAPSAEAAPVPLTETASSADAEVAVAPEPEPVSAPESVPAPEIDAVNITEEPDAKLFVVDTLLDVRPLQFEKGAATLLAPSAGELGEVADLLNANPELQLQVESHAAPVGNAELNMLLSRRRAIAVIRLLEEQGIDPVRLKPRAFGDKAPIAGAASIDENDRVEFRIR